MNPIRRTLLASALTPAATAKSFAQSDNAASDYPRRPITIIVAFAPGASAPPWRVWWASTLAESSVRR